MTEPSPPASTHPLIGIGYRAPIRDWTLAHLDRFDVLEITVDHCIYGGKAQNAAIFELVDQIPLTAHGIGLSIGTDVPLDLAYLERVAEVVERLGAPAYSEHLAFTRVPGRDLANLLPLPKTEAVAVIATHICQRVVGHRRERRVAGYLRRLQTRQG